MTTLEANRGNVKKTARETGISPKTLREWRAGGKDKPPPEKSQALIESYLEKAKRAREALLDRLLALAPVEADMFKVAGAYKIVAEAASDEEVNGALARRIAAAQTATAPRLEGAGSAGSQPSTLN